MIGIPNTIVPTSNKNTHKVIVITGANGTIGKAISSLLMGDGNLLILVSKHIDPSDFMVHVQNTQFMKADLTRESQVKKTFEKIISKYGRIDVLINAIGVFMEKPLDKTTLLDFEKIIDTNIRSIFLLSREVVDHMKKRKEGIIINLGSKISHNSRIEKDRVLYAASKYAVEGFSQALHRELLPYGIRVTCLMPATVGGFNHLDSKDLARLVSMIIHFRNINFEGIVFQANKDII